MRGPAYLFILVLTVVDGAASGMFVMPSNAPVERLIKNTRAYIKEEPKDPEGYYTLARIHYLAFANRTFEVPVTGRGEESPPAVAPDWLAGDPAYRLLQEHATKLTLEEFGVASPAEIRQDKTSAF